MDEPPGLTVLTIILIGLMIYRLLNNLLRAGYFGLGRISLLALAEKAGEENHDLLRYLEDPLRLNLATMVADKISLVLLAGIAYHSLPLNEIHFLGFFVYLVLFDVLIPGMVAASFAEPLVLRLFPVLKYTYLFFSPIFFLMGRFLKPKADPDDEEAPEDVAAFLRAGAEEGIIEEKEKPLLHNLLAFNDTVVREVMTPRTDMECLSLPQDADSILEVFKNARFSRLPVYHDDIDHIDGVVRFKDVIQMVLADQLDLNNCINEMMFVPEMKNISDLLNEMLEKRMQMAIVLDEYGGTAGLITLEDLIEEIVGEIHDEHEEPDADDVIETEDGSFLIDGKVLLENFSEMFQVEVESEDIDTIGGYIFNSEGRIPDVGSLCRIGDIDVEITKADDRRIYQLKVDPVSPISQRSQVP